MTALEWGLAVAAGLEFVCAVVLYALLMRACDGWREALEGWKRSNDAIREALR